MRYAILLILINMFCCFNVFSATKICEQDFESSGWEDDFTGESTWGDNMKVVTNNPHGGTKSLRWNQMSTRTDPITGLVGIGNTVLDYRGTPTFTGSTPNEMYFSFWFRHDDYTNTIGDGGAKKLFYLVDDTYGIQAMYLRNQYGTALPRMAYGNGGYSETWAENNWGYGSIYLREATISASLNGTWRRCEMYFNYTSNYFMMWIDGTLLLPTNSTYNSLYPTDAAAGRVKWDPSLDLHYKGIQFFFFSWYRDIENEADGDGYWAGIQIDDIEVWDGMPTESPDDIAPYASGFVPSKSATNQSQSTDIVAHGIDVGDGVDIDTIEMEINSTVHCYESLVADCDGGSGVKDLVITGTSADYLITWNSTGNFNFEQVVSVILRMSDLAGTPNVMSPDSYSFTIEAEGPSVATVTKASGGVTMIKSASGIAISKVE